MNDDYVSGMALYDIKYEFNTKLTMPGQMTVFRKSNNK